MTKSENQIKATRHEDITEQAYRGTNEVVSGLGYGAVETKAGMLGGVVLGAGAGALLGERVINAEERMKTALDKSIQNLNKNEGNKRVWLKPLEWSAKLSKWLVRIASEAPDHLLEVLPKGWQKSLKNSTNYKAGVTGAGLGALAGIVFASITGAAHGAIVASNGRKQFNSAKDEIRKLRQEKTELEGKYEALQNAHNAALTHTYKQSDEFPDTIIDASSIEMGKRREDTVLEALPTIPVR